MNIPKPPTSSYPEHLREKINEILRFVDDTFANGTSHKGFTQEQINAASSQELAGKTVLNETTGDLNYFSINPTTKALTVKVIG
jgi:glutathionyl-hydroquinone reductase